MNFEKEWFVDLVDGVTQLVFESIFYPGRFLRGLYRSVRLAARKWDPARLHHRAVHFLLAGILGERRPPHLTREETISHWDLEDAEVGLL